LRIKSDSYELVLAAHRSARTALLLKLAGIPERVGFRQSALPSLYNLQVDRPQNRHETLRNLALLEPFGVDPGQAALRPVLPVTGEEANHVFGLLGVGLPRGSGPLVLIAPGSVWGTKRWLGERYGQLVDELAASHDARVIMIGSIHDRPQADKVLVNAKSTILDLTGMTDLRELCALVRKADLVVTGDSAPMHLAWAFDVPTVAIFGATVPELGFAPLTERCRVVEMKGLECRPCSDHGPATCPLGHFLCMNEVTVEMVLSACAEMLNCGAPGRKTDGH
ncbi:MAG TPA: glycosyltransferase family 9 protein, partial [Candidatus Glassbacteria bacterium]|nr:glycosyltransferase family 9 protein [Candidatus Glassbacteria bacterium]